MKALTIWQPWATCIAVGLKKNETRSWCTSYRGPIALHAAKKNDPLLRGLWLDMNSRMAEIGHYDFVREINKQSIWYIEYRDDAREIICDLEFGAIVATANLVDCIQITPEYLATLSPREIVLGDYTLGRYAWVMENVCMLQEPIYCTGYQSLWNTEKVGVSDDTIKSV